MSCTAYFCCLSPPFSDCCSWREEYTPPFWVGPSSLFSFLHSTRQRYPRTSHFFCSCSRKSAPSELESLLSNLLSLLSGFFCLEGPLGASCSEAGGEGQLFCVRVSKDSQPFEAGRRLRCPERDTDLHGKLVVDDIPAPPEKRFFHQS